MTTTTNLGLKKPEPNDYVDVSVLNENMDKLDEVIPDLTGNALKEASTKSTPADNDCVVIVDSADRSKIKRILWGKIKALFSPAAHASQHGASGSDPITLDSIGAVAKSGDTMTGNLNIQRDYPQITLKSPLAGRDAYVSYVGNEKNLFLMSRLDANNRQGVYITPETSPLSNALRLMRVVDGNASYYNFIHTGNLSDIGIARIATGTYVGTGTCGPDNPNSLNLPFSPKVLAIAPADSGIHFGDTNTMTFFHESCIWISGTSYTVLRANTSSYIAGNCYFTVSGNSISWHSDETSYPETQMNTAGTKYAYIAIG